MNRLTDDKITNLIECASLDYLQIGQNVYSTDIAALKSIAATNLIITELLLRLLEKQK